MRPKGKTKSTALSPASQQAKKEAQKQKRKTKEAIHIHMYNARRFFQAGDLENAAMNASWACEKLSEDNPDTEPFEFWGEVQIECDNLEGARKCFLEAVRRKEKGDGNVEFGDDAKYSWLGQLSTGLEAVEWYKKGQDVLLKVLEKVADEQELEVKKRLSVTCCSIVELYLTDLCMEEDAEKSAEQYALQAIEYLNNNPIGYQQLASVRLSQQRNEEAKILLEESLTKWLDPYVLESEPTYSEKLNLVKLLLEVELYESAFRVLEKLQREDDEHVEFWYLYTCAYFHDPENSREDNWKNARECAETCLKWYKIVEWDDEELKASCEEMLKKIEESGIVPDKEDNVEDEEDEEGDEEEWESDEDVEMQEAA